MLYATQVTQRKKDNIGLSERGKEREKEERERVGKGE